LALGWAGPAHAGAWIAPDGGQQILTLSAAERDLGAEAYVEAPLNERLALLGVARSLDGAVNAEVSVKTAIWRGSDSAGAAQFGALYEDVAELDCDRFGTEARGLSGWSAGGWFFNLELAHRQAGDCGA
jgi:hypothetical protein